MAGNESDARRSAENAYNNAISPSADRKDLDRLFAAYSAAQAKENSACGTSYSARKRH